MVIPTQNRAPLLRLCLAALAAARAHVRLAVKVVVVDDGSTDDTGSVLAEGLRTGLIDIALRNDRAKGPAAARNLGWRAASADLIAFTDDDCEVDPAWLAQLASTLGTSPAEVAAVGGAVRPAGSGMVSSYMTLHRILEPPASLGYVVTANCMFRRSALEAVGGFDEAVRSPGGEDPGVCMKLRRLGFRFERESGAVVTHRYREGVRDFLKTFYRYGKGCRIVMDS